MSRAVPRGLCLLLTSLPSQPEYIDSTYGDGHWYSEDATEKGKRKAEEDEDEELQSAKRHRATVDVTEPEAHLTHEEIARESSRLSTGLTPDIFRVHYYSTRRSNGLHY